MGYAYDTEAASKHEQSTAGQSDGGHRRSSGIGLSIAKRLVSEGTFVYITSRRQSQLDSTGAEIGDRATGVRGDTSSLADLDALYERIGREQCHIDVLVANAGTAEVPPLGSLTEEHFDKSFSVNVKGVLFTVQQALPLLRGVGHR